MKPQTGEKLYQCTLCSKPFSNKCHLNRHMKSHTGKKPYKCTTCGKGFAENETLKGHVRTHTGEKPYKCTICDKEFRLYSTMKNHVRTHTGEKPYKCDTCGAAFAANNTLKMHIRTHTGEKPHQCKTCGRCFSINKSLKVHMTIHTGDKPYQCRCGKRFAQINKLKVHMRTHTGEKPYQCTICGVTYAQNRTLKIHMKTHTRIQPHKCSMCGKNLTHIDTVGVCVRNEANEKVNQCTACLKKQGTLFDRGVTGQIAGDLMMPDENCSPKKSSMKFEELDPSIGPNIQSQCEHLANMEKGSVCMESEEKDAYTTVIPEEKIHECTLCGQRFSNMDLFDIHMISHRDEKPFKCTSCGAVFELPQNTYDISHAGDWTYQCSMCGTGSTEGDINLSHTDKDITKVNSIGLTMTEANIKSDSFILCTQSQAAGVKPIEDCVTNVDNQLVCVKLEERDTCVTAAPSICAFKCISCGVEFKDINSFDAHVRSHTKEIV